MAQRGGHFSYIFLGTPNVQSSTWTLRLTWVLVTTSMSLLITYLEDLGGLWVQLELGLYEVGFIFLVSPKRTPKVYTHQYEKGTLYTLTKNSNINPASYKHLEPPSKGQGEVAGAGVDAAWSEGRPANHLFGSGFRDLLAAPSDLGLNPKP